jgi:hypothetical protein
MSNIFAYTAPGSNYPEFISVNSAENGLVEIIVRHKVKEDGRCGDAASILLTKEQALQLSAALLISDDIVPGDQYTNAQRPS